MQDNDQEAQSQQETCLDPLPTNQDEVVREPLMTVRGIWQIMVNLSSPHSCCSSRYSLKTVSSTEIKPSVCNLPAVPQTQQQQE